ncbi:polyprenyl synthetase family protein [Empedobacter stercoris]|uniref:Polyprenyl synthetase family protein n=1 Tax=Empedobacter stercoris TaxID=1628248 RepID=A0ABX1WII1_9FLAO|nr:polyprenyl synthetase family protein [Empedobacter stercoris]HJD87452.1 polyprenyl synthetase family protein [Empedobacter falsenii]MCA4777396.1 polyprenyl synthetase family protein [Empedobacter stercoris]MCA4781816.1 polyprenyl synthetase family protein [Empedobacter stercoris]MCA4810258.1 polyprenyl synthetase family protein [Empedobacter stercoris]NOJ74442.1 polyprenyl synthetase family protein [Empedobacter stercoris]
MYSFDKFHELISETIDNNPFSKNPEELYEPMDYILNIGGKRIRPILTLLGTDLFDGDVQKALKPSLAIEFFHNFSLMHDDIMDNASLRRNKATVHEKFGLNTAILSGDAMLVKAYQYLEDMEPELFKRSTKLFSHTALEVCEGQQLDVNYETKLNVSYEDYIKMISLKTSVLLGCALKLGAMIGNASEEDADKLYQYGLNLGIAYQLKDDYLDVFGSLEHLGKKHAGDIFENKKTILYISALEAANEEEKEELLYWYSSNTDNIDKVYAVEKLFRKLNVNRKLSTLIREYTNKAHSYLDQIDVPEERKTYLRELSEVLIDRQG